MGRIETLLYILNGDYVLLIEKKRGIGKGLYNGVGGKINPGETPVQAAIRECKEEIGVTPIDLTWRGILEFHNDERFYGLVYVFLATQYKGKLVETDEARPVWFRISNLPYDRMWKDDRYWLPLVLEEDKTIFGRFVYKNGWSQLIKKEIYLLNLIC